MSSDNESLISSATSNKTKATSSTASTNRFDDLFPKLKYLSIEEKIKAIIEKYDNKYFVDRDLDELEDFDEKVIPKRKITSSELKVALSRHVKLQHMKLSWAYHNKEEYAKEFIRKVDKNEFNSVVDAEKEARDLYAKHSPNYQNNKAVVSSENGKRIAKRSNCSTIK